MRESPRSTSPFESSFVTQNHLMHEERLHLTHHHFDPHFTPENDLDLASHKLHAAHLSVPRSQPHQSLEQTWDLPAPTHGKSLDDAYGSLQHPFHVFTNKKFACPPHATSNSFLHPLHSPSAHSRAFTSPQHHPPPSFLSPSNQLSFRHPPSPTPLSPHHSFCQTQTSANNSGVTLRDPQFMPLPVPPPHL